MILQLFMQRAAVPLAVLAGIGLCTAAAVNHQGTAGTASGSKSEIQRIIFSEQKIEGKIRRPQLVLITADERPHFTPMVMQMLNKSSNAAELVDPGALDMSPNHDAFQFEGTKIAGMKP